jgi:predicted molibdopterin-dependent oxidoreductase YjgC
MPNKISIRIDGELIHASTGQSILEAALAHNKFIPSLCHMKGLKAVGPAGCASWRWRASDACCRPARRRCRTAWR